MLFWQNSVWGINIPIVSAVSHRCKAISIQSDGDSKYVDDGFYEKFIFGRYHFALIDERGNDIYHANIKGTDWFILKDMENDWVVSNTYKIVFMLNLHK